MRFSLGQGLCTTVLCTTVLCTTLCGCTGATIGPGQDKETGGQAPAEEHPFEPARAGSAEDRGTPSIEEPVLGISADLAIVAPSDEPIGEDGDGNLVASNSGVSISIPEAAFAGTTSADPVLRIDILEFRNYTVVGKTLRFVVADAALVEGFDTASLEHGDKTYELALERVGN
tara:strand:+ start:111527 stop:112045 length:519 start_codon:yes stop_codon:yes gene_type:complete